MKEQEDRGRAFHEHTTRCSECFALGRLSGDWVLCRIGRLLKAAMVEVLR